MADDPAPAGRIGPGEPAPWFVARSTSNDRYQFGSVAGRYVVLCFFGSAGEPQSAQLLQGFLGAASRFDDENACFFGVSEDEADRSRVADRLPGIRYFWDPAREIRAQFGLPAGERCTYVLDIALRIVAAVPFGDAHVQKVLGVLGRLPPIDVLGAPGAPVLVVPALFEIELCRRLIDYYNEHGGEESGFMREERGVTVGRTDPAFKRRRDCDIADEALRLTCNRRVTRRLGPLIARAFQFQATRMERYIVACYDEADRGHFRAHRDNTTRGTAHRRFAVSLFLNSGEYEGGELRFPEFGRRRYSAPPGGAVVFSCSLLHEALPVTKGRRYMFLPFLYDDAAAKVREENARFLERGKQGYKA